MKLNKSSKQIHPQLKIIIIPEVGTVISEGSKKSIKK